MLRFGTIFVAVTLLTAACVETSSDVVEDSSASSGQCAAAEGQISTIFQKDLSGVLTPHPLADDIIKQLAKQWKLGDYGTSDAVPEIQRFAIMNTRCNYMTAGRMATPLYKPVDGYNTASWVDSFSTRAAFIASPAPKDNNEGRQFWRMVWRSNVRVIAMVTRSSENGHFKSAQYWPTEIGKAMQFMGAFKISAVNKREEFGYVCTQLTMWNLVENSGRGINHCIFTEWPDMDIPQSTANFIQFRNHVKRLVGVQVNPGASASGVDLSASIPSSPILVHCMAGLGRTGTFIAVDVLIERMECEAGRPVDLAGVVQRLRLQRPNAILTPAQYYFCITALKEYQSLVDDSSNKQVVPKM